jgi:hypothetical protein
MRGWNITIVAIGVLVAVVGAFVSDPYLAAVATAGAVLAALSLNYMIPRRPRLVVTYTNPATADRPVVWNDPTRRSSAHLHVLVDNRGRAPARAVEVEFDYLGMAVFNASGNSPNPQELDARVNPPRFMGGERVLNPGDSPWRIAGLFSVNESQVWRSGTAQWRARAEGMEEQTGTVEVTLLDGPPT